MRIKVYGTTAEDPGSSLCERCRYSRITRGRSMNEELVVCEASHSHTLRIHFRVTTCTRHVEQDLPSYFELLQQAWILEPGTSRKPAGFVRASEIEERSLHRMKPDLDEFDV